MIYKKIISNASKIVFVILFLLTLTIIWIIATKPWSTRTRIVQEIILDHLGRPAYTIKTQLQYFDEEWHTACSWDKLITGDKIVATKKLQRDLAETRQQCLERDLKNFYSQP